MTGQQRASVQFTKPGFVWCFVVLCAVVGLIVWWMIR